MTRILEERDDLSFIANILGSQIEKLRHAGVSTMGSPAMLKEVFSRIGIPVLFLNSVSRR